MKKSLILMGAMVALGFNSKSQNVLSSNAIYGDAQSGRVGLCLDSNDNAYILGSFQRTSYGRIEYAGQSIQMNNNNHIFFIAKYNNQGVFSDNTSMAANLYGQMTDLNYKPTTNKIFAIGGQKLFGGSQKGYYKEYSPTMQAGGTNTFTESTDYVLSNSAVAANGDVFAFGTLYQSNRKSILQVITSGRSRKITFSSTKNIYLNNASFANDGKLWVVGNYDGDLVGAPSATNYNGVIMRLNSNALMDSMYTVSGDDVRIYGVQVQGDNVYMTGVFKQDVSYRGSSLTGSQSEFSGFVMSISRTGNLNWLKKIGSTDRAFPRKIAVNDCGDLAVVGYYTNGVSFGTLSATSTTGENTAFVLLMDKDGNGKWIQSANSATSTFSEATKVKFAKNGTLWVAGQFSGSVNFGTDTLDMRSTLSANGNGNLFLYQFDVPIAPNSLTINGNTVKEEQEGKTFVSTITSSDCKGNTQFNFSLVSGSGDTDNGMFSVSNDSLYMVSKADFETKSSLSIRLQAENNGETYAKAVSISVTDIDESTEGPSAIIDAYESSTTQLYPNPTSGLVTIKGNNIEAIRVVSLSGNLVIDQREVNSLENELNLSELEGGVFYVQVYSSGHREVFRVVKL